MEKGDIFLDCRIRYDIPISNATYRYFRYIGPVPGHCPNFFRHNNVKLITKKLKTENCAKPTKEKNYDNE